MIIIIFGENNVLCPKYINIYEFRGVLEGCTNSTIHFLFIIKKKQKKYKRMTYTIKFQIILILKKKQKKYKSMTYTIKFQIILILKKIS